MKLSRPAAFLAVALVARHALVLAALYAAIDLMTPTATVPTDTPSEAS